MGYTIGIDAGGTKTTALVLDNSKNILFQIETGFGNPNVAFEQALMNIWTAASTCLNSEYGKNCNVIVAGIAGIEAGDNREKMLTYFKEKTKIPVILINDAVLAYHALLGQQDGVLTIAGTGSISYGKHGDIDGYAGGWGHLLGDFGSGYDIVIQAIRKITREVDNGIPHSPLSHSLLQELGLQHAAEVKGFIYKATKGEIAALSHFIFIEATHGDVEAQQLFTYAGRELANQTISLQRKLGLQSPLKVACKGSILEENQYVKGEFVLTLQQLVSEVELITSSLNAATGALSIARLHNLT